MRRTGQPARRTAARRPLAAPLAVDQRQERHAEAEADTDRPRS
ncbi:hypothetical protein [Streptomyces sp. ID05-18]|nr:hypothetical protein [Streptomyces sp. ID05-18]MDX3488255.1 hypothetical protein [Streptomyces sp. ID05-18]